MKPDIEKLLNSEDKNSSIIAIDNYVCELCKWGDSMEKLTEPQRNFYFNQNLEREINNGGFNQYFWNSSGNFVHQTIKSLQLIGADKTANILQTAIAQFPNNIVPEDLTVRQEVIEQIEESANEVWGALDQKFFAYEDDLNALNLEYVRQNKQAF